MAKPKLALIPAAQGSRFYSVLPSDGVGDFTFARASAATRINKYGLIETVASGQSRLNYPLIDGVVKGCPHHILEPSRTNLIQYSEDFTEAVWLKTNTTVISNDIISPDGTLNASRLTDNATDGFHVLGEGTTFVSGQTYTATIFAKKGTASRVFIGAGNPATWGARCYFDLDNGTVSLESIGNAIIEDYGNGWYRCTVIGTANANASTNVLFGLANYANDETYIGSGDYAYFWGAQVEQGSYATSYIPNFGTVAGVTRSAETANGAGDASTFNDSEGVLMAEISALANDGTFRFISISDGTIQNRVSILFLTNNNIYGQIRTANTEVFFRETSGISIENYNKIAVSYKTNECKLFVNGMQVGLTATSTPMPIGLNDLAFDDGSGSSDFYGNTKQIQYFDTALTDSELETLTSWVSFQDMAEGQLYTIE